MQRHVWIFAVAVITCGALSASGDRKPLERAPTQDEIWRQRDRTQYDDGGAFSSKMSDHGVIPRVTELRVFILTHWHEHRRGYVSFTSSYIDSATIWHFFVEPTDTGEWHVTLLHFLAWYGVPGAARWETLDQSDIVSVQREKPTEEDVHGGDDVLVLKDNDGRQVLRL
jgi:hypothetical protein